MTCSSQILYKSQDVFTTYQHSTIRLDVDTSGEGAGFTDLISITEIYLSYFGCLQLVVYPNIVY